MRRQSKKSVISTHASSAALDEELVKHNGRAATGGRAIADQKLLHDLTNTLK